MGSVNEAIPEPPSTEIFTPLNRKKNETRLISLLPATFGSPKIKCELQIISLDNPPSYPALSYVWGDHSDAKEILLNGIPYKVTANLHYALLHLRRADKPLIIWIDALCINQDDLFERNHQVSLMHLLYGNADHVIVWLGKESDDSDQAMDFIESLGNSISIRNNDNSSMVVDITSASSRSNWTAVVNIL